MARYKYEVTGSLLSGNVSVSGAKNAVLPILAATLINKGVSHINNVPYLSDIDVAIDILRAFNCYVERSGSMLTIDASNAKYSQVPELLTSRCRASLAFVGSSIGRFGEADIALPGGCVLGPRPVDMHIDVMKALGLNINDADTIHVWGKVHDNEVLLPYPSVGVTENVLMMAATGEHTVIIKNAAREPEIVNLCQYLTSIGAYIEGAGTKTIIIRGSRVSASEVYVTIIPDRIEAATYVLAGCLAGRGVNVTGCNPRDLKRLITLLYNMDCEFEIGLDNILVSKGLVDKRLTPPLYVVARPYPAFPTDMQPLIMPLLCLTASESFPSILADTVFPCRFGLVDELKKMGANIHIVDCNRITGTKVRARAAVITGMRYGGNRFAVAKDLISHDLRGGAALILAALAAEPGAVSDIYDEGYIMRGYENISEKFSQIGGNVSVKLLK